MTMLSTKIMREQFEKIQYQFSIYTRLSDITSYGMLCQAGNDIFFEAPYLELLEHYMPEGIRPYYVQVGYNNKVVGLLYFQLKYVRLAENLRVADDENASMIQKAVVPLRNAIVKSLQFQTLICGNLLVTGSYGFKCVMDQSPDRTFDIVTQAMDVLKVYLEKDKIYVDLMLIKDLYTMELPHSKKLQKGFTRFSVQPKMIFDVHPQWDSIDDYMSQLKSKYRVRAKKAIESGKILERKRLDYEDIVAHRDVIYQLYKCISDQAGFNAFLLHPLYFENLKLALGDKIQFNSYWMEGRMIAFYTSVDNYNVMNAHFLGYNVEDNRKYHLYLNILLDIICEGIENKVAVIDLSRTAIEIKSSVGAVPEELFLFVRHTNPIINKSLEMLINVVNPENNYVYRQPFK